MEGESPLRGRTGPSHCSNNGRHNPDIGIHPFVGTRRFLEGKDYIINVMNRHEYVFLFHHYGWTDGVSETLKVFSIS